MFKKLLSNFKNYNVYLEDIENNSKKLVKEFKKDFLAREYVREQLDYSLKLMSSDTKNEWTLADDFLKQRKAKFIINNDDFDEDKYIKQKAPSIFNQELAFYINKAFGLVKDEKDILKDIENCEVLEINRLNEDIEILYKKKDETKYLSIKPIYHMSSMHGLGMLFKIDNKLLENEKKSLSEEYTKIRCDILTDIKQIVKIFHLKNDRDPYYRIDFIEVLYKDNNDTINSYRLGFIDDEEDEVRLDIKKYENIFSFKSTILDDKYKTDEEIYLNPKTSLNKKLEIMDKVVCRVFANASRWDNVNFDDEKTAYKVANYDFYLNNTYLCQVDNKEEMYIEYLKCYLNALSDPFFMEEVPLEDEFIRQKCKEANLLNYYYSYYFKRKKSESDFIIFSKSTSVLSQWYKCKFEDNEGFIYNSAEQYMMAKKALLFKDEETYHKIMKEDDLSSIKKYGREIRSFDNIIWDKYKEDIVYKANFFKFFQNEELKTFLKSTGNKVIVEANPNDNIWACGLKPDDENIYNEEKWKGQNLLGKIIMQVRDVIYEDDYRNVNDILVIKKF